MNDQSGPFHGSVLPFEQRGGLPAQTGLQELVAAQQVAANRISPSEIWRTIVKWWWLILAIVVAFVVAAVGLSLLVEPQYRAKVVLEVNRDGVQVVQMGELQPLQTQDREFIATQAGLLRSRGLAERVSRSLNLANHPAIVDESLERATRDRMASATLLRSVSVEPVRDSRLIELKVVSTDPELAARIANAYGDNFIRSNLERRYQATSYARNFLEQRLGTVRSRLENSERQLVAYAQQQGIITLNVDSGSGQGGRSEQPLDAASLITLNETLQQARAERIAAEQRYRQAQANGSVTESVNNATIQRLTQERAGLQAQYEERLGIYQPDYPQMQQMRTRIQALDNAIAQERRNVSTSLQSEFAAAAARESALQGRVNALRASLLNLRERSIQYTILQREVDTNRALYDALLQRYKEVGVAGGVGTNAVSVVDAADVPSAPFKPDLPLNVLLGLLGGLVVGFGAAFALEWMDDSIKTPDDLTNKLGIASLGVIPATPKGVSIQEDLQDARSKVSEAYHSLRTALQFSTDHGVPKSLLVTSTRAGEGKSSSALALSQTLASLGATVLLVDADLRKPTFRAPDRGRETGLSAILSGSRGVQESIHPTDQERLFLLPSGQIPPNPAELLASDRLHSLVDEVMARFDHVIVDAPPVLGLADAPLLAASCEGTIMIIEAASIRRTAVLNALNRLRASGARIMGGVLTKFSATKSGYGYGYGYGYGEDQYAYRQGQKPKRQIELVTSA